MPPRASSAIAKPAATTAAARRAPRPITPEYVESLKSYARLLFDGGLAPKGVKRPETVAALIQIGRDVGLPDTQAVAWIAIINGRPSIYGDAGMALIRSSGLLEECSEWYEGTEGEDDYTAVFKVKRVGAKEERVQRFSIADAKRANLWRKAGPWTEYPYRQLMWRAKGFACRDEFQDVLCGLVFVEEAEDTPVRVISVAADEKPTPAPSARSEVIVSTVATTPQLTAAKEPTAEPETFPLGPITDAQLDRLADLQDLVFASKGCRTDDDRDAVWSAVLADFGVESARDLTGAQAAELIEQLAKVQDPFTHPPAAWSAKT